jgi:hypothetical protein
MTTTFTWAIAQLERETADGFERPDGADED